MTNFYGDMIGTKNGFFDSIKLKFSEWFENALRSWKKSA